MKNVKILFGTSTGNTETAAQLISELITEKGDYTVTTKNVTDANQDDLTNNEILVLGSSTWGDGELQDDFSSFFPTIEETSLENREIKVFACGESSWPQFCVAADIIEEAVTKKGAKVTKSLKIDGDVDSNLSEIKDWVNNNF